MSIPLQKVILKSTVYIKNSFGNVGTGFLISKSVEENRKGLFLITNKHMLRKDGAGEYTKSIDVRFYAIDQAKGVEWVRIPVLLDDNQFANIVFMHPKEEIDIVGILISPIAAQMQDRISFMNLGEDTIVTREISQKEYIDSGEDLVVLGYPAGIFSENNYLPLMKSGLLASSSSEDLLLKLGNKEIKGKIYLVEGALFGGNSGGPVLVKVRERIKREEDGLRQTVQIGQYLPIYLLGVQSSSIQLKEKIYTRIFEGGESSKITTQTNIDKKVIKDSAGEYIELDKEVMLNVVFSAEYLNDIFDLYLERFKLKPSAPNSTPK